jgi:hypothetical protein
MRVRTDYTPLADEEEDFGRPSNQLLTPARALSCAPHVAFEQAAAEIQIQIQLCFPTLVFEDGRREHGCGRARELFVLAA